MLLHRCTKQWAVTSNGILLWGAGVLGVGCCCWVLGHHCPGLQEVNLAYTAMAAAAAAAAGLDASLPGMPPRHSLGQRDAEQGKENEWHGQTVVCHDLPH